MLETIAYMLFNDEKYQYEKYQKLSRRTYGLEVSHIDRNLFILLLEHFYGSKRSLLIVYITKNNSSQQMSNVLHGLLIFKQSEIKICVYVVLRGITKVFFTAIKS